tara:strand:- start:8402 stop:9616 length:1215 start_codon:yes stop_codon:yes gene_type:complete
LNDRSLLESIDQLPWCVLVASQGRSGVDFLHSLFDSHPQIITFNGFLLFHDFWEKSRTVNHQGDIVSEDLVDEFVGHFIHKLRTRYDFVERKDKLGDGQDQSFDIDISVFRSHLIRLVSEREITSRNVLQSVYVAYALTLGDDFSEKRIFLHQLHQIPKIPLFLKDFPGSRIVTMTRDPRAAYVSSYEHHALYNSLKANPARVYKTLARVVKGENVMEPEYGDAYRAVKLEDLHDKDIGEGVRRSICAWAGVDFHPCMFESTWGGLKWWGDRMSSSAVYDSGEEAFEKSITKNKWQEKLSWVDKYLFEFLLSSRLAHYGYPFRKRSGPFNFVLAFLFIPIPNVYEWRFIGPTALFSLFRNNGLGSSIQELVLRIYYYLRRVLLYFGLFWKRLKREPYRIRILGG